MSLVLLAQTAIPTPDTTSYLWLALAAFFILLLLFLGSMVVRARNLHRDEEMIEQVKDDQ